MSAPRATSYIRVGMTENQLLRAYDLFARTPGYTDLARQFEDRMTRLERERRLGKRMAQDVAAEIDEARFA